MAFGFGRIEFDGNVIELNRPWSSFQSRKAINRDVVQAESGLEQTLVKFEQYFVNARLNLLDPQENQEFRRLFEYAEAGGSFTLIRDRNLGTYIPFEGGINPVAAPRGLKTIDDVDGTFTRSLVTDSAWYLDEGTGLMTVRNVVDQPRFPEGKFGAGIRIDGTAANLITHPSASENAAWTKNNCTAATTTETLDPAGVSNARIITGTGASPSLVFGSGTAKGNNVADGIWLKVPTGTLGVDLGLAGSGGGSDDDSITITTQWRRFSHTAATSGFTGNLDFRISGFANTDIFYMWGAGMFDSFEFDPGTIGAISTSSITMAAEKLTFPSANVINKEKGSIAMWVKPSWNPIAVPQAFGMLFEAGDSAGAAANTTHRLFWGDGGSNDRMTLVVKGDNADIVRINYTPALASGLTADTLALVGATWDSTISNGGHIYVDGSELSTGSSNSAFNVSDLGDTMAFGSQLDRTIPFNGVIDEVLTTKNVLSAQDFADIHALGLGLGIKRNRFTVTFVDPDFASKWLSSDIYDLNMALKEVLS